MVLGEAREAGGRPVSNVTSLSNVQRLLEAISDSAPDVVMMVSRNRDDHEWHIGRASDLAGQYPLAEMLGMVEVLKAHLLDAYFEGTDFRDADKDTQPGGDSDG